MAKRRTPDTDSESDASDNEATQSKRVRLEVEKPGDVDSGETLEEKELEAKFGDRIRRAIETGEKLKGRVAQSGVIQRIEVFQFMCHPRLHFDFGPQVNFIIGHNGSGKSAILSAITVALGGKATTTGRGSGLKSFIREGQNQAEVTITIKNEGEDAYKPEIYGDSIIITRRFSRDGSSSYKIKSKGGRVINTTRAELSAICDHMNIQVDNPLNILSQDQARQFLSSSHPRDKYEFFLKGTQLQQLSEEYALCLQNITNQGNVIKAKEEALPILEEERKQAKARFNAAQKAIETKAKLAVLKKEVAWCYVKDKENEMNAQIEEAAKIGRKIPKIERNAQEQQAALDTISQELANLEVELKELGDMNELTQNKERVQTEISRNKEELRELANNKRRMDADIKRNTNVIKGLEEQIRVETAKLETDKQAEREEREREMDGIRRGIEELEAESLNIDGRIHSAKEMLEQAEQRRKTAAAEKEQFQGQMEECYRNLKAIENSSRNSLNAYGNNLLQVRQRIEVLRWHGQKPIGPIGDFVALNDQKWINVIRILIGRIASAFAITDPRDKSQLQKLLAEHGNYKAQIFVSEVDLFDYSSGEPPQNYLTVLRALTFKNEFVKRILINQSRIERILLAERRIEGEKLVNSLPNGGTAWTADMYRVIAYGDGGNSSNPLDSLSPKDPRNLLFIDNNIAGEKQTWREKGKQADTNMKTAVETFNAAEEELTRLIAERRGLESDSYAVKSRLRTLKQERERLNAQHDDDIPVNIGALELEKQTQIEDRENIKSQFEHVLVKQRELGEKQTPLMRQLEEIRDQVASFQTKRDEVTGRITGTKNRRTKVQNDLLYWQRKLQEENGKVAILDNTAAIFQAEFEEWAKKAEDYCDGIRIDQPRETKLVERQIRSCEAAVEEQEKAQGATTEELETRYRDAERKYAAAKKDIKDLSDLQKLLKSSMNDRLDRWHEFRKHIALRTKLMFQYLLSTRAYYGKVLFEHDKQKLEIRVQTDDQAATQGLNKDAKSLSGGEKSFSTICLLLALWQAIGCPIRCLDEFDVFMDAVNRRISMKMLVETGNSSDSKQYILITPQDITGTFGNYGDSVRIQRMRDPERGQGTLNIERV